MAGRREAGSIGQRIAALRRERGFKAARDLAAAISGGNVTTGVLENVESGRKADLSVSQLLNIARALRVPPSYLLATVWAPGSHLDLLNLSDDFAEMTAGEFDAWFSGVAGADYRSSDSAERMELDQLDAYRTLRRLQREILRLSAAQAVLDEDNQSGGSLAQRRRVLEGEATELENYLRTADWDLRDHEEA